MAQFFFEFFLMTLKRSKSAIMGGGSSISTIDTQSIWLILYFTFSLLLTIYNKAVMQLMKFSYPWLLTGIHTLCGWIGCRIFSELGIFTPSSLSKEQRKTVNWFSVLYTANIAVSNISLNLVTVPVCLYIAIF